MTTKMPVEWNVYVYDINSHQIKRHNIFNHYSFVKSCAKQIKRFKDDKKTLSEQICKELMYYYWFKSEWEVLVSPIFTNKDCDLEIDVYDQVKLNWNSFFDYFWEHRKDILKLARENGRVLNV